MEVQNKGSETFEKTDIDDLHKPISTIQVSYL